MDTRPDVPMLSARLRNTLGGFGDDMLRISGIGEFATSWPLFGQKPPDNYTRALQDIARAGWAFQQHSLSAAEDELTVSTFETVNKTTPIARSAMVAGARRRHYASRRWLGSRRWARRSPCTRSSSWPAAGAVPPLRTIVDSGITVGAGSDSAQISTLNPWLSSPTW